MKKSSAKLFWSLIIERALFYSAIVLTYIGVVNFFRNAISNWDYFISAIMIGFIAVVSLSYLCYETFIRPWELRIVKLYKTPNYTGYVESEENKKIRIAMLDKAMEEFDKDTGRL